MSGSESADLAKVASGVQDSVSTEMERVVRRWHQLPLDRALSAAPGVHVVVQSIADEVADSCGAPRRPVPDLGPAILMDQLRVMVFDHHLEGLDSGVLARRLADLRRSLP
ncbi:MAG: hypothetical protein WA962_00860 [Ornithinimicrobium sp.]